MRKLFQRMRRAKERINPRWRNRRLLKRINAAYGDGLDEDEKLMLEKIRRMQKRLMKNKCN